MRTRLDYGAWWPFGVPRETARTRLICFPFAGSGASIYRAWRRPSRSDLEVCPVQLPGREARIQDAPFRHLEPLIEELVEVLRPRLTRPYAFFGHSMGALIAFELAHLLRRLELPPPVRLFVSAARPPHLGREGTRLHALPDAAFMAALRDLNGTPEEVLSHPELMTLLLPTLRADFELCETYQYRDRGILTCPITAFGGTQDRTVPIEDLQAWAGLTGASFDSLMLQGGHFFLGPCAEEILGRVTEQTGGAATGEVADAEQHDGNDAMGKTDTRSAPGAR